MAHSVRKRIKRAFYRLALKNVYADLLEEEFARRVIRAVDRELGHFQDGNSVAERTVTGVASESGVILGEVVYLLTSVAKPSDTLLLPGERRAACHAYSKITGIPLQQIVTAGIHGDMDFAWNYENPPPPNMPLVNIIASQAILEHLIDPYRHICDLFALLKPGGQLIVHTVMPGFKYHRFPVDCMRFHPDWFEATAERLRATVSARFMSTQSHLVYCLTKP